MRGGRISAMLTLTALTLAACGSGSPAEPTAEPASPPTAQDPSEGAPDDSATITDGDTGDTGDDGGTDPAQASPPADTPAEPSTQDEPAPQDEPIADPGQEPTPTPTPEDDATTAAPDDGCSVDNSPMPVSAAEGPAPAIEVRAESVDSPLPDLAVRRINCAGGWVNLRNELPSEQPLLVWFWAPH